MLQKQPLIGFTALDGSDTSAVTRFWIRRGVEVPAAMDAATTLRGRLEPLTGCVFNRQSVIYPAIEPSPGAPAIDSNATRVGVFVFSTDEPGEYAIIELPGLADSFLLTTGPGAGLLINPDDPAVQAFVNELISGSWYSPFGYKIAALEAAFLQVRP